MQVIDESSVLTAKQVDYLKQRCAVICNKTNECTVGPICDAGQPHERGEGCQCETPCRIHAGARCVPYAQAAVEAPHAR